MVLPLTGAGPSGAGVPYLLRATFDAPDQGFADAQVLNTVAEGIRDGQLTVVEVAGTLAIVSKQLVFTDPGGWDNLGVYSQVVTRQLGRGLLFAMARTNWDDGGIWGPRVGLGRTADILQNDYEYCFYCSTSNTLQLRELTANTTIATGLSQSVDYQYTLVLGGYDANGVPWHSGAAAASYLYGASLYIEGGVFATPTLLWRSMMFNTATLYAGLTNGDNVTGTLTLDGSGAFRVPDVDLKAVLQPTCLSTFTAPNGTSLDAITPEVGGAWTEQSGDWDIQGNRAQNEAATGTRSFATVNSLVADVLVDAIARPGDAFTNSVPGLLGRFTDTTHHWRLVINEQLNLVRIEEVDTGVTIRAIAAVTINVDTDYDLRMIMDGQTIDGFVDGGNKISYGSAALNEIVTVHGIVDRQSGAITTRSRLDNFHISARTSAVYDQEFGRV